MKAVKIFLCCLLAAMIFTTSFALSAVRTVYSHAATGKYARADAKDIYFCKGKNSTALFTIPYTYCVEIISADGDWYYVKYAENNNMYEPLYGYCKSENLTVVDEPPENIFLFYTVPLTFRTDTFGDSLPVNGELTVNAAFYGSYYSGGYAYSYVRYDGNYYYISGANDDYPVNEIKSAEVFEPTPEEKPEDNSKLIIGLVLAGVAVAALIIIYLTGRRGRYFRPDR